MNNYLNFNLILETYWILWQIFKKRSIKWDKTEIYLANKRKDWKFKLLKETKLLLEERVWLIRKRYCQEFWSFISKYLNDIDGVLLSCFWCQIPVKQLINY